MRLTPASVKKMSHESLNTKLDANKIKFVLHFLKDNQLSYIKEAIEYGQAVKWRRLDETIKKDT